MEDTDDQRGDEIMKMPQTEDEAENALDLVESLLQNFKIVSPQIAGNALIGFSYHPIPGASAPESQEGPEGPERPEQ